MMTIVVVMMMTTMMMMKRGRMLHDSPWQVFWHSPHSSTFAFAAILYWHFCVNQDCLLWLHHRELWHPLPPESYDHIGKKWNERYRHIKTRCHGRISGGLWTVSFWKIMPSCQRWYNIMKQRVSLHDAKQSSKQHLLWKKIYDWLIQ